MGFQSWQLLNQNYDSFLRKSEAATIVEIAQALQTDEQTVTQLMHDLHRRNHIVLGSHRSAPAPHDGSKHDIVPVPDGKCHEDVGDLVAREVLAEPAPFARQNGRFKPAADRVKAH